MTPRILFYVQHLLGIGHLARANPQWQNTDQSKPALAVFMGPDAYVSPSWYPSKAEHGRVVPTWNYVAVHAYGVLRFVREPDALRRHLARLTATHEGSRAQPWSITPAPGFISSVCVTCSRQPRTARVSPTAPG